jgi:DNA-binding transcriptional ArsR family regulator
MVKYQNKSMESIFHALADPTRQQIIFRLAQFGEQSVMELAEPFDISLPAISKHLRLLEHSDLIIRHKEGRTHKISLNYEPMLRAADWLNYYRLFWESQLDSLEDYLNKENQ